ncbi:MAG: hypothetical protein AAGB01_04480 [Cyanobacteria bacterium P01_F01_bin.42]
MLFKSEATRRRITLVAGAVFAIGMGQSLISGFTASSSTAEDIPLESNQASVVDLEKGYEIVLEREPDNQTALEGLVEARLAREQWESVIPPLERLVELNPTDEAYVNLMAMVQATIEDQAIAQTEDTTLDE